MLSPARAPRMAWTMGERKLIRPRAVSLARSRYSPSSPTIQNICVALAPDGLTGFAGRGSGQAGGDLLDVFRAGVGADPVCAAAPCGGEVGQGVAEHHQKVSGAFVVDALQ